MRATLVRDPEVHNCYDRICWLSVGQEPDLPALQNTLGLPGTQAPKRPGEEEPVKEGFSAWEQPNWWNKPPEWIDSLPWWLEGYLESKAREGELAKDKG